MKLLHSFQTLWKRNRGLSATLVLGGLSCTLIGVTRLPEATSGNAAAVASGWSKPLAQGHGQISQRTLVSSQIERNDFFVPSDPGIQIAVREVRSENATQVPILLIHGGGPGGTTSFDLNVPGYSLAADFAQAGHPVYVMNLRGWENSTRPDVMNQPPENNPPAVTSAEAVRDIGAAVDAIRRRYLHCFPTAETHR